MKIVKLADCAGYTFEEVGGKAKYLGLIQAENADRVPGGVCILCNYLKDELLTEEDSAEINRLLKEVDANSILCRKNLYLIRSMILGKHIDDADMDIIIRELTNVGVDLSYGVAVRSSSVAEDREDSAYAGVFVSTLDIKDREGLEKAILKTLSSFYSEASYYYSGLDGLKNSMAVVIQQMVYSDVYGVAFSKSPTDSESVLIEISDKATDIVEGKNPEKSLMFNRIKECNKSFSEMEETVYDNIMQLENTLGFPVDVEFAYSNGKMYILQCRPISYFAKAEDFMILDQDNVVECNKADLLSCKGLFRNYLGKQYRFRSAVRKYGFHVYKQFYIVFEKKSFTRENVDKLKKLLNSEYLIVHFDSNNKEYTHIDDLYECIFEHLADIHLDTTRVCCRVGEIIRSDIAGYSSMLNDGSSYIEYITGRMHGLLKGTNSPAKVVVSREGVNYLDNPVNEFIETVDVTTGKRIRLEYGKTSPPLTADEAEQLDRFTRMLSGTFGQARLEWYFSDGKLYGKDISMENQELDDMTGENVNVLSFGFAEGTAYFINDLLLLDDIATKYHLSLVSHSDEEEKAGLDETITELRNKFEAMNREVIIFAERPSIGLIPLIGYVKGFVFKQGSLLSHVSITLREKSIPALIDQNDYDENINCKKVRISPTGVRVAE